MMSTYLFCEGYGCCWLTHVCTGHIYLSHGGVLWEKTQDQCCGASHASGLSQLLSSNLLRISAHLFGAPLPCPSPCPLPGVFSLCPMDHLTVRTLWYFSRYFSHFSLPRNVLHCEGIEPHTFCFLSLIFDSVACATVQWLSLT